MKKYTQEGVGWFSFYILGPSICVDYEAHGKHGGFTVYADERRSDYGVKELVWPKLREVGFILEGFQTAEVKLFPIKESK